MLIRLPLLRGVPALAVFVMMAIPFRESYAEVYTCTCQAVSCGNGATSGTEGKVYRKIPEISVARMFAPERTGAAKTGWACVAEAAPAGSSPTLGSVPKGDEDTYTCTCKLDPCGGSGVMSGTFGESRSGLAKAYVASRYRPDLSGGAVTGWNCVNGLGQSFPMPAAPAAVRPDAATGAVGGDRYTCICNQPLCGGKDGVVEGERGQQHTGISGARLGAKYGPERKGDLATGWNCKSEEPPPKYACTCTRDVCRGDNGIIEGDRDQRHSGIAAGRLQASYGPERIGSAATGWTCEIERRTAAVPGGQPAGSAGVAGGVVWAGVDPGYVCECQGLLGCGQPYAKRGEVREGVPGMHINSVYHSDQPGSWVCTRPASAASIPGLIDPGYVCRCNGHFGCGAKGSPRAKRDEVREGVPASHINTLYHSDEPGGWVCTLK